MASVTDSNKGGSTTPAIPIPGQTASAQGPTTPSQGASAGSASSGGRQRSSSLWSGSSGSPISSTLSALQTPNSFTNGFPRPAVSGGSPTNSPFTSTTGAAPGSFSGSPLSFFLSRTTSNPDPSTNAGDTGHKPRFPSWSSSSAVIDEDDDFTAHSQNDQQLGEDETDAVPGMPMSSHATGNGSGFGAVGAGAAGVQNAHMRRASFGTNGVPQQQGWAQAGRDRAAGVMRRLSLSGALSPLKSTYSNGPASAHGPGNAPLSASVTSPSVSFPNAPPPTPAVATHHPRPTTPTLAPRTPMKKRLGKRSVSPMGERMLKGHFDGFHG